MKTLEKMTKAELIAAYQKISHERLELLCEVQYLKSKTSPKVHAIHRLRDDMIGVLAFVGTPDEQIAQMLDTTARVVRRVRTDKTSIKKERGRPKTLSNEK